ncbi:retinol dehydrogenase 16-like [Pelobates fuscus]|uniref:retinol dehydrogenase 16-like n=1 Tax=Pelobates fuscus TaxID=191477 RepID=UPI002FE456AC
MWLPLLVVALALLLVYRWHRQKQILENLSDKYVLITGCDTGLGNVLAKQLDRHGMRVLAACLTEKGAEDLKKETSSRLQTAIVDISDSQSVSSAVEWVTRIVGDAGLWGLVNNAGTIVPAAPIGWLKKEDYARVLNINLLGTVDVTLKLLPLVRRARGRIIIVSSILGRLSVFGGGYALSKFGLEAFGDSLRRELSSFGVKVSIVEPGAFKTSIISSPAFEGLAQIWKNLPAEIKESYGEQYYKKFAQTFQALADAASSTFYKVSDCMEHALTACHPWTRYSAGWDAKLYFIPLSYLPTCISDLLLSVYLPKPYRRVE